MSGAAQSASSELIGDAARSAMLGVATGGRTFTGIAMLATTAAASDAGPLSRNLARTPVRVALGLLAIGELIGDKLPQTPSRLSAAGLPGRLLFGGLCGAVVAQRNAAAAAEQTADAQAATVDPRVRTAVCVGSGVATAFAGSWLGVRWRAAAAPRPERQKKRAFGAALAEDATSIGLAFGGARR